MKFFVLIRGHRKGVGQFTIGGGEPKSYHNVDVRFFLGGGAEI